MILFIWRSLITVAVIVLAVGIGTLGKKLNESNLKVQGYQTDALLGQIGAVDVRNADMKNRLSYMQTYLDHVTKGNYKANLRKAGMFFEEDTSLPSLNARVSFLEKYLNAITKGDYAKSVKKELKGENHEK